MNNNVMILPEEVVIAYERIRNFIKKTPILSSTILNSFLGHNIYFKAECFQTTGSFKIRGAFNNLLNYKEKNNSLPKKVIAFSSGNHGQGLACACRKLGIDDVIIYMTKHASKLKMQSIKSYGAQVVLCDTRDEIYNIIDEEVKKGAYSVPTSDDDMVIAGQGTLAYESLLELKNQNIDAIFCPAGGGGLASGTYLASQLYNKNKPKVYAVEPELANDISRSIKLGKIFRFKNEITETIADGARTPWITERVFNYIKKVDDILEATEKDITYWAQWINHLLKITIEPTAALSMVGCYNWLKTQSKKQNVLIILSGGNLSKDVIDKIWKNDHLSQIPELK